jgi:hypothetical protein
MYLISYLFMRSDLHESLKTSSQLVPDSLQVSRKVRVPADKGNVEINGAHKEDGIDGAKH